MQQHAITELSFCLHFFAADGADCVYLSLWEDISGRLIILLVEIPHVPVDIIYSVCLAGFFFLLIFELLTMLYILWHVYCYSMISKRFSFARNA